MSGYPFDWVDAFAERPFQGNGCAVVQDGGALTAAQCLAYTRETGLVECTFVGPSDRADVRVRYFFPTHEIPFAGHPTIATVHALLARGLVRGPSVTLETGAGVVPVEVSGAVDAPWITMTQNPPIFGPTVPAADLASVVGLEAGDIVGVPQVVSTGLPFCVTVVRDIAALRRARLDFAKLEQFQKDVRLDGAPVMEPYLVILGGATAQGDTFGRLLLAPPSPPEDPFTGSATGCAASYLWRYGMIDAPRYTAEQGHDMGRPGRARVEVLGPRDAITGVRVSGQAVTVMSGMMFPEVADCPAERP